MYRTCENIRIRCSKYGALYSVSQVKQFSIQVPFLFIHENVNFHKRPRWNDNEIVNIET